MHSSNNFLTGIGVFALTYIYISNNICFFFIKLWWKSVQLFLFWAVCCCCMFSPAAARAETVGAEGAGARRAEPRTRGANFRAADDDEVDATTGGTVIEAGVLG